MKQIFSICICLFLCIAGSQSISAQDSLSVYNHNEVFDPTFFSHNGNVYRSANGAPGPKYWQNSASYTIHATLDEKDTTIKSDVSISYTNNSPDTLNYLWLQLDQNLFNPASHGCSNHSN